MMKTKPTMAGRIFRSQALRDVAIRRRAMRQRLEKRTSGEPVVMRVRMAGAR